MANADVQIDPKAQMEEALSAARAGLIVLRDSVVASVMRRNKLQEEVNRLEKLIFDLDTKAALAAQINNTSLAGELKTERTHYAEELERMRSLLTAAETGAEAAKARLPEEEAQIQRQIADIQAHLTQTASSHVIANPSDGGSLWERAADKIRNLQNEASSREEVAAVQGSRAAASPMQTPEQSADAMLTEMETRLNSPAANVQGTPASSFASVAQFLELDAPAVQTQEPNPAPQSPPPNLEISDASAVTQERETAEPTAASARTLSVMPPAITADFQVVTRPQRQETAPELPQRVRVAAVGTGGISQSVHIPAYVEIPQMQLVAICDPDRYAQDAAYKKYQAVIETKIHQAAERHDYHAIERYEHDLEVVQICDDVSEIIETVKPDLVDICTQPFLHVPLSIQLLEAGFHVMCEKPLSRSWLESERLLAAVEKSGKIYQHNENWLWEKEYYTAKKLIDAGVIGEPVMMFLATAHGGPEGNPKFWNPEFGGGGSLLDMGVHAIGAAWLMCGLDRKPTLVKSADPFGMATRMPQRILGGRYQNVTVDDDAHILVRFEDPKTHAWTTAHIEGSWSHRDSPETVVIGTTGKLVFHYENDKRYIAVVDAYDRETRRVEATGPTWQHWPSSYYGEILNMVECVRNSTPSISDAQFGAECSAIVGASYLSEKNGRSAVTLDEFKAFARDIAAQHPDDPTAADNALVEALLSAVRKS